MHETGLARMIFPDILKEAKKKNLKRVKQVKLGVGEMFTVKEELLRHSFRDHVFPGTIAEGATVEVVVEPVSAKCSRCGTVVDDDTALEYCPACNAELDVDIIAGDKMRILEIK